MFRKLMVANRGEIACRVLASARKLGIATVAVYSDADRDALHVSLADEAVHIGPAPARDSYLRADVILQQATAVGADAIHPGYGFLSENADFARACDEAGIRFIGPDPEAIDAMGSKSAAKRIMEQASVPLVPGYHGDDQNPELLRAAADDMGYPVLLKAVSGGGGKGMRQVWSAPEFDAALAAAQREASASFGDQRMLVEKYLTKPRHVEIQVFCDTRGGGVYLSERDCSVQRRHQKIIEEAPAPGLSPQLRKAMGETAVQAARAINYTGAGTVEFLLDEDGSFYFMEMNTRLQVEHPVTEMITGLDLVEWQLRVAAGEPLPLQQAEVVLSGHAFEARVYAEDPDNDFLPATGTLHFLQPPEEGPHVRVDTGVRQGDEISVHYDPMIAKLVVWDENRDRALDRLRHALANYRVGGTVTNLAFLYNLASAAPFRAAQLDTGFIEHHRALLFDTEQPASFAHRAIAAAALLLERQQRAPANPAADPGSPWGLQGGWRLNETHRQIIRLRCGDAEHALWVEHCGTFLTLGEGPEQCRMQATLSDGVLDVTVDGHRRQLQLARNLEQYQLFGSDGAWSFTAVGPDTGEQHPAAQEGGLTAPMNGTVVAQLVAAGSDVAADQPLLVMEAMKMEHTIRAPGAGQVSAFHYAEGELVDGGALLLDFIATPESAE